MRCHFITLACVDSSVAGLGGWCLSSSRNACFKVTEGIGVGRGGGGVGISGKRAMCLSISIQLAHHKSLATSSLAISKDSAVVTSKNFADNGVDCRRIHINLSGIGSKYLIKGKSFHHFICHFLSNDDFLVVGAVDNVKRLHLYFRGSQRYRC